MQYTNCQLFLFFLNINRMSAIGYAKAIAIANIPRINCPSFINPTIEK
ncbi:hypothetical protein ACFSTE_05070 [Aquimarina hainanensis]|uniref:Uncharacterized protein n=1 Tax=Aquimarina hainanensis TaxID=1578017 RepID=A0ABW5N3U0_9FLAO